MTRWYLASIALGVLGCAIGCSGGDAAATGTPTPPTSAQSVDTKGQKGGGPTASEPDLSSYKPSDSGPAPGSALGGK